MVEGEWQSPTRSPQRKGQSGCIARSRPQVLPNPAEYVHTSHEHAVQTPGSVTKTPTPPPPGTHPRSILGAQNKARTFQRSASAVSAQLVCATGRTLAEFLTLIASSSMPLHRVGGACMASSFPFFTCDVPVMAGVEQVDSLQHPT